MDPLIHDTLRKIKDDHIQPEPEWKFRIQNSAWWIITVFTLLFAGIATALATHLLIDLDWDAYGRSTFSRIEIVLSTLPLAWIVIFSSFLIFSYFNLRHTRHGYQYATWILFSLCFIVSVGMGFVLALLDLDQPVDQAFSATIPQYITFRDQANPSPIKQWSNPEKGLLGGMILSAGTESILLQDFQKQKWHVALTPHTVFIPPSEQSHLLRPHAKIKIIGIMLSPDAFEAKEIRSWKKSYFKNQEDADDTSGENGTEKEDAQDNEE